MSFQGAYCSLKVQSVLCVFLSRFMPPDDPLGRHGPSLDNFLRKKPLPTEQKRQLCPYGKIWLAQSSERGTPLLQCAVFLYCILRDFSLFWIREECGSQKRWPITCVCVSLFVFLRQKVHLWHQMQVLPSRAGKPVLPFLGWWTERESPDFYWKRREKFQIVTQTSSIWPWACSQYLLPPSRL